MDQKEERLARRAQQEVDGKVAMAEYLADTEQRAARIARQKAERLARDAELAANPPVKVKTAKTAKSAKK